MKATRKFITVLTGLLFVTSAYSQVYSEVKTDLMWVEDHPFFYTESFSDDYYLGIPFIVSYDEANNKISVNNYLKGYYILENALEENNPIKYNIENFIDDILYNDELMSAFYKIKENKKSIKLNKVWIYSLAVVTYQDIYLGRFKRLVPNFSSSKDLILKYDEMEVPVYFMKIINIEPYR